MRVPQVQPQSTRALRRPTAFNYPITDPRSIHARIHAAVKRMTGVDLLPSDEVAALFMDGLYDGDPIAERFVQETFHGELGPKRSREMLEKAAREGIESVPDAPESLRALIEDFEREPEWLDRDLVEEGAAVWRRWGYALGGVGNAGTMDTYTERWLALPLSLSGGYAGDRALHRYLETSRWWIEVSRPGALFDRRSMARFITLHVRVMHVSVRERVKNHPEWDADRLGLPISQSAMLLTLLGGSVAPAVGLYALGYLTSPREIEAVSHFNRYLGYLLGVRADDYYPATFLDGWRILFMCDAARAYDSGALGEELVESFVPSFQPRPSQRGLERLRALYHYQLQAGYSGLFILPWNRRRYQMPSPFLGIALLAVQAPLTFGRELARHLAPCLDGVFQKRSHARWERWQRWQAEGKEERFEAATALRR